jgi:hypothetical protein
MEPSPPPTDPTAPDRGGDRRLDPLDERLRGAMRALGEQTPQGYFEALPAAITQRLNESTNDRLHQKLAGDPSLKLAARAAGLAAPARRLAAPSSREQTQLGAPRPWWHSRTAVVGLVIAAAAALVLVVSARMDRSAGRSSAERLGAASGVPELLPARPRAKSSDEPASVTALRRQLTSALPAARGCLGPRPAGIPPVLSVRVVPGGTISELMVSGRAVEAETSRCLSAALSISPLPSPSAAVTIELPLYE